MKKRCDWPGENKLMIEYHVIRIGCHEQIPQETRLQVRRLDNLLRLHAIGRNGQ